MSNCNHRFESSRERASKSIKILEKSVSFKGSDGDIRYYLWTKHFFFRQEHKRALGSIDADFRDQTLFRKILKARAGIYGVDKAAALRSHDFKARPYAQPAILLEAK